MARRVIARFVGTNREFKKYLETLRASELDYIRKVLIKEKGAV